jgi:hypothetical protein
MRLYNSQVARFYHIKSDSKSSTQLCGGLYSHPVFYILAGSLADDIRIFNMDKKLYRRLTNFLQIINGSNREFYKQESLVPRQRTINNERIKKLQEKIMNLYGSSTVELEIFRNVKFSHTFLKPLSFYHQANNMEFMASLSYTNNSQRLSRLFYTSNAPCLDTIFGRIDYHKLKELSDLYIEDVVVSEKHLTAYKIKLVEMIKFKQR